MQTSSTPIEGYTSLTTGIFGTIFQTCQIRIMGPTGLEKVIELQDRPFLPLWLYLVARTEAGGMVSVGDLLRDVYGLVNERKASNRLHDHCRVLRRLVGEACAEVGHPKIPVLLFKRQNGTAYWRLSDAVQREDLERFQECGVLLAGIKDTPMVEEAHRAQVKAACERVSTMMGNLSALLTVGRTHKPWIYPLLKEALDTYHNALKYLAIETHAEAERTSGEEAKRKLYSKELRYWKTYALSCASRASILSEEQEKLLVTGEIALRKALSRSLLLYDPFEAVYIYYTFQRSADGWVPDAQTVQLWQQVCGAE